MAHHVQPLPAAAQNIVPELTEHWRHVVYACYQPRTFAQPNDLRLKAEAWDEYRVTTHWPARNIALFPKSEPGKGSEALASSSKRGHHGSGLCSVSCLLFMLVKQSQRHRKAPMYAGLSIMDSSFAINVMLVCHYRHACTGYYGEDVAAAAFTLRRNRDEVGDQRCIRQLAGVEQYEATELRSSMPLLEMPEDEIHDNLYHLQQA